MSAYAETDWTACGLPTEPGHNAFSLAPKPVLDKAAEKREKQRKYERERYAIRAAKERG